MRYEIRWNDMTIKSRSRKRANEALTEIFGRSPKALVEVYGIQGPIWVGYAWQRVTLIESDKGIPQIA